MADRIRIVQGDITQQGVDAIVNAANTTLLGGGGVDGAIHRAAGPALRKHCATLGGCPTGEARITPAFNLHVKWIIHTVGPVWGGGKRGEDDLLASCYRNVFDLAAQHDVGKIAFPSISTGAYRFPVERAAGIAIGETRRALGANDNLREVRFVCFDAATHAAYEAALAGG
jgi:O-acetyl-ADP-ribose deacetylase